MRDKHLRLVLEAPEGRRMDNAVPVTLKRRARLAFGFWVEPAPALRWITGIGRPRSISEADAFKSF